MKMTFRWYGDNDPVTLEKIRQIPKMTGIVSAVYDVAPGGVWSEESIAALKKKAQDKSSFHECKKFIIIVPFSSISKKQLSHAKFKASS